MVNEGEGIIVEEPSFIGSLNSFRSYNARLFGVEMAYDGIDTDKVEEILKKENIKLIYILLIFHYLDIVLMEWLKTLLMLVCLLKKYYLEYLFMDV